MIFFWQITQHSLWVNMNSTPFSEIIVMPSDFPQNDTFFNKYCIMLLKFNYNQLYFVIPM
jgi:hypothetical protein